MTNSGLEGKQALQIPKNKGEERETGANTSGVVVQGPHMWKVNWNVKELERLKTKNN